MCAASVADISANLRRSVDGSRYLFIFNNARSVAKSGTLSVTTKAADAATFKFDYKLEPFEAKLLYLPPGTTDASKGEWLPKPVEGPERPIEVTGRDCDQRSPPACGSGPEKWTAMVSGEGVEATGIFDRRYVYYRAKVAGLSADHPQALLITPELHDSVIAEMDGHRMAVVPSGWGTTAFELSGSTGGEVTLLYENPGRPNGGKGMEAPSGIKELQLVDRAMLPNPIGQWRMKAVENGATKEVAAEFDDSKWMPP